MVKAKNFPQHARAKDLEKGGKVWRKVMEEAVAVRLNFVLMEVRLHCF